MRIPAVLHALVIWCAWIVLVPHTDARVISIRNPQEVYDRVANADGTSSSAHVLAVQGDTSTGPRSSGNPGPAPGLNPAHGPSSLGHHDPNDPDELPAGTGAQTKTGARVPARPASSRTESGSFPGPPPPEDDGLARKSFDGPEWDAVEKQHASDAAPEVIVPEHHAETDVSVSRAEGRAVTEDLWSGKDVRPDAHAPEAPGAAVHYNRVDRPGDAADHGGDGGDVSVAEIAAQRGAGSGSDGVEALRGPAVERARARYLVALYSPGDEEARRLLEHTLEAVAQARSHCFSVARANIVGDSSDNGKKLGVVLPEWHEIYFDGDVSDDAAYKGVHLYATFDGHYERLEGEDMHHLDHLLYALQHKCGLTFPDDKLDPVASEGFQGDEIPVNEFTHDEL